MFSHLLAHRCDIQRATKANVDGEIVPAWSVALADVACLIQEERGDVRRTRAGDGLAYDAIGFFSAGTDIRPQGPHDDADRLIIRGGRLDGVTFLVEHVSDESGQGHHLVAYLRRLPAGG